MEDNNSVSFDQGWFVIQTYAGYERKVKEDLLERAELYNMADKILRVEIPTETIRTEVNGKMKEVEENLFPGYVLVEMNMTDEAWFIVRNTPNVTGFVGSHGNRSKPTPLFEQEIQDILVGMGKVVREIDFDVFVEMNMTDEAWFIVRNTPNVTGFVGSHGNRSKPTPLFEQEIQDILVGMGKVVREIDFDVFVGKRVRIVNGAFSGFEAPITEINGDKLTLTVDMFGRATPVELDMHQIEDIQA